MSQSNSKRGYPIRPGRVEKEVVGGEILSEVLGYIFQGGFREDLDPCATNLRTFVIRVRLLDSKMSGLNWLG